MPDRATAGTPVVSKTWVRPAPPVISAIRATTSSSRPSMTCVAPRSTARASRSGTTSTAMSISGSRNAAATTPDSPTAPVPKTATRAPGCTSSAFHTEPKPVITPQPSGAMVARSASGSTTTTLRSSAMACWANDDWAKKWLPIGAPSSESVAVPSSRAPANRFRGSQVVQYAA